MTSRVLPWVMRGNVSLGDPVKRVITLGAAALFVSLSITPAVAAYKLPTFDAIDVEAAAKDDGVSFDVETARLAAREAVGPVIDNLDPDVFTGAYFTRGDGAPYVLHVVTKEGVTAPALDLSSDAALDVIYETGKFSKTELDQQREKLLANLPRGFVSVGTDLTTGQLRLTVDSPSAQSDASTNLPNITVELGKPLTTASGTCYSRLDCRPWRGGIGIVSATGDPYPDDWELCSFGFMARGASTGVMKMITAAHCNADINADGTGLVLHDFFDKAGRKIAESTSVAWSYGTYCDCMKAGDNTWPPLISPNNYVYHDDGSNQAYAITSVRDAASQHVGDGVWLTGVNGGSHYTTIWDDWDCYHTPWKLNVTICGVKAGGYSVQPGDSGGSAYFNHGAMGINSAIGSDFIRGPYTMYIRAQDIQNQLNVWICVTSSC